MLHVQEEGAGFRDRSLSQPLQTGATFFTTADSTVNDNLLLKFASVVQPPEARCFYSLQITIDNAHADTFSLLIVTLIPVLSEHTCLFQAILCTLPCVHCKTDCWALR
jgi:hypothetical protein